jgi:hypothetical protein
MRLRSIIGILAIALSLNGCMYKIWVSGLGSSLDAGFRFVVLPMGEGLRANDLQFQEYASYIIYALAGKGYEHVEALEQADVAVFLDYGIGNPEQVAYTYAFPVYVPGSTTTVSGYSSGTGAITATATTKPTYKTKTGTGTRTQYTRRLVLDVVDVRQYLQTEEVVSVWKTTVTSTGKSGDLRTVFPYLVYAAVPHLGKDTGKALKVTITDGDLKVLDFQKRAREQKVESR